MVKKWKVYLITFMSLVICVVTFFGLTTINAFAFSGTNISLTEQELYNATNTYNVKNDIFTDTGVFLSTRDEDRITEKTQYNIAYNMSQKNNNQVIIYTSTTTSDENVEEFTWDYRATVSDSNCTPLGNISDSY